MFPGQGSQALGMGIAVADAFAEAAAVFARAGEIAGYDIYELCADGPLEKLSDTRYTQPALFTVEAAIVNVLRAKGIVFDAAAGHSLGEFAAWYASGALGFEDGLRLVCERGRLMAEADPTGEGTMGNAGLPNQERVIIQQASLTLIVSDTEIALDEITTIGQHIFYRSR